MTMIVIKPDGKTVFVSRIDDALYAEMEAHAKAEDLEVKAWIAQALHHALVRSRMEQSRIEAQLAERFGFPSRQGSFLE